MKNIDKILIIGCGGHCRFMISVIRSIGLSIEGIIDTNNEFDASETIMGINVIGSVDNLESFYKKGFKNVSIALGDNELRKIMYKDIKKYGFNLPNIIHPSAKIDISSNLDEGNIIGPNVVLGAETSIGSNNILNSSSVIEHQCKIGNHCHVSLASVLCGNVTLGDEVFVGANSTVIENLNVANRTKIGASTTVISDINEEGVLALGSPHKIIKT